MGASTGNSKKSDSKVERNALRLLCSVLIQPVTRAELLDLLDASLFDELENRVAYEEIKALGAISSPRVLELLPARMVNRGFAEFDLKLFLGDNVATEAEVQELFQSVLQMIEARHREDTHDIPN